MEGIMGELLLRIITGRDDGCYVKITWEGHQVPNELHIQLLSPHEECFHEEVWSADIEAKDLAQWIHDHHDW
jgi:hypothetical protein